jgi:hypothetical protein
MDNVVLLFIKRYDFGKLLTKLGGVGGSFIASHFVALTTTPAYASWWARIYMTAPQITDVPAFEKMVTVYFSLGWLILEHMYQRISTTAPKPPEGSQPT